MKVAFISFDFGEYCIRLASALARDAEVLLIVPDAFISANSSLLSPAVQLRPFTKPRMRQPLRQAILTHQIHRWVGDFDPDVVHFQHRQLWFNLSLPLLRRYPLVVTIHDPREHQGDRASRMVPQVISDFGYHRADEVIVHAEHMKTFTKDALHIPEGRIHVVPHIALGKDEGDSYEEEGHLVLFFGRIWGYKGLDVLIRAEPLITDEVPDARIVIAGQGEDFERYRRMMVHPESFVVHNTYVSDQVRAELFQRSSLVVLPYVEATQSGVIPVAYTFAKPVVATTVGGLPEQVDHGQTGYLVAPRDVEALADAVVRLLKDRELRHRLGRNGRRKLEAEWAPEVVARQTLGVYHQAVRGRQPEIAKSKV